MEDDYKDDGGGRSLTHFITTEQYMFRRLADICLDYFRVDKKLGRSQDAAFNRPIARELANIFESVRSFVKEDMLFPEHLRNPPLADWALRDTRDPTLFVLHPRCAKDYVMSVYREIKRQQSKQKRAMDEIHNKFKEY